MSELLAAGNVSIPADTLRALVGAAESYAEDLSTGLDDGTYEEDPGLADIEEAIEVANAILQEFA